MATLFGRPKGKSSHDIKYTELPQHLSEDEDELCDAEDDLLFVRSPSNGLQNGSAASTKRNGRYRKGEVIELGNLRGSPVKATRYHSGVEVRQGAFARKCFFIGALLSVGVFVVVLAIGLPTWTDIKSGVVQNATWTTLFDEYGSESCVELFDVDGDGILDVLLGMGSTSDLSMATSHDPEQFCKDTGRTFPCLGLVVALKGTTGQELWRTNTDSAVFLMNCREIDVDQDGRIDCIMTGRQGTIVAINPRNGEHMWRAERTLLKRQWNIYKVSALPDADGDGVPEILVPHGGEPRFAPEVEHHRKFQHEHHRHAGRLIIISGRTGKTVGFLEMPNSKETYMSPVIYTWDDGSQYILFGSGGETIPGDFMAISMRDFYRNVLKSHKVPDTVKGHFNQWDHKKKDDKGIITIFNNTVKSGIMVPPVLVDVDRDGVKDILMLAFEGKMCLFDGRTLKPMWNLTLPGFQAYSTPAPGFFDVDEFPDFMVVWNNGTWPDYSYSQTMVVSGADGAVLWKTLSQEYNMASPLSLATRHLGQDVFLYEIVGREGKKLADINGAIHGLVPQRNVSKRHADNESMEDFSKIYNSWKMKHSRKSVDRASPLPALTLTDQRTTAAPHTTLPSNTQAHPSSSETGHSQSGQSDRNGGTQKEGSMENHISCDSNLSSLRAEVFLMDRTTLKSPILLFTRQPEIYNYTITDADRKLLLNSLNKHQDQDQNSTPLTKLPDDAMKDTLGKFCTVLKASILNTGAVGDVDGDGRLDYVLVNGLLGLVTDRMGSYIRVAGKISVVKLNLVSAVEKFQTVNLQTSGKLQHAGSSGKRFQFLSYDDQSWTAYLGKHGNGVYTPSSYRPQ